MLVIWRYHMSIPKQWKRWSTGYINCIVESQPEMHFGITCSAEPSRLQPVITLRHAINFLCHWRLPSDLCDSAHICAQLCHSRKKSSDQDQSEIHWRNWSWWWCIMLETRLRFQNPTNKYDILAQLAGRIGWLRWWGSRPSFDRLILWWSRTRSPSYCKILLASPSDGDATRYCNFRYVIPA